MTDGLRFDAFGMVTGRTGTTPTPFGFVGSGQYQTDGDTGLLLLGHRYYDASVGRFLTADPAKAGGNWYAYCDNNPLNAIDPLGFSIWGVGINVGISAGTVGFGVTIGIKGDSNGTIGVSGSGWGTVRFPPGTPGPGVSIGISHQPGNLPVDQNGITSASGGATFGPVAYIPPITAVETNSGATTVIIPTTVTGNGVPGVPGFGFLGSVGGTVGINGSGLERCVNDGIYDWYHLSPM